MESKRVDGKVRQEIIASLGRLDKLQEGDLDSIIEGLAKYAKTGWIRAKARSVDPKWAKDLGPAEVFRKLWEDLNLDVILDKVFSDSQISFDAQEAVFAMVLNRLCDPTSKLGVTKWKETVYRPQFEKLQLQHFCRSLDLLAEHKDEIEVRLFERVKNLFNLELDLAFWDTTSTYFEGRGVEGFTEYGFSKDHRCDSMQVVIGVLMTREGIPVAHQVFPGNSSYVETFRAALMDLWKRFGIGKVIMVADRGMVSRKVLDEITTAGLKYIAGVRMRKHKEMKKLLTCEGSYHQVKENLRAKEVIHEGKRYIICYNSEEEKHERLAREEIIQKLEEKLESGKGKSLISNGGYRRYLKLNAGSLSINREVMEEEAVCDGKYVLETNTELRLSDVALAYKGLWQVENCFRELKSGLELRPVYHWTERRIRGHIMVCFLAFVLENALRRRLAGVGCKEPYRNLLTDLEQLKVVKVVVDGKSCLVSADIQGKAYEVFKSVGLRPPKKFWK